LRAWESRYSLLSPERSTGGFRLYSAEDESRVRLMQGHLSEGLSAAEAARLAKRVGIHTQRTDEAAASDMPAPQVAHIREELRAAIDAFDGARLHDVFDTLIASFTVETVLRSILLPHLRELGDSWARGEVSVAQEHFASGLFEGRLLAMAQGWDRGVGPRALLACPSGERHTLGLVAFGLALHRHGWRITYLGADTPADQIVHAAASLEPAVIALASVRPDALAPSLTRVRELGGAGRLVVGGAAAFSPAARRLGWEALTMDPVSAAGEIAAGRG
jgi:DNA-binding transcriptional MerR regulator/methylmalonyl-CoA mutase cobalamin-binding subunit